MKEMLSRYHDKLPPREMSCQHFRDNFPPAKQYEWTDGVQYLWLSALLATAWSIIMWSFQTVIIASIFNR